ncbi:MAG: hypothetical protein FWD44_04065 [Oscillospiraceae bacterium]|nr:hypothetical protein [Oscillospiraceae bacterium]
MKKIFKRVLPFTLAVMMVLAMMPVTASAVSTPVEIQVLTGNPGAGIIGAIVTMREYNSTGEIVGTAITNLMGLATFEPLDITANKEYYFQAREPGVGGAIIGSVTRLVWAGGQNQFWGNSGIWIDNDPGSGTDPTPEPTPDPTPEPTPDPTPEPTPDPMDKEIEDALNNGTPLVIAEGGSTTISAANLQAIKAQENPLDIALPSGLTITINPASITANAKATDLNIAVNAVSTATAVNGASVPANSIVIAPTATGEFGFTIEFTISAAELTAAGLKADEVKLYYINANGQVRSDVGEVAVNSDGSATVKIKQASRYVLANESTPPISRVPQTSDNNLTILWIGLMLTSGLGIIVSVICIKNRKVKSK